MSWSPSPYPYPTSTPSSPPFSFTYQPTPFTSASPEVIVSYVPMQTTYSASPVGLIRPMNSQILYRVSDDALYGIICAIAFVILYTSIYSVYYYKKYKKEKLRLKRLNELQGKVHSSLVNPAYQA